MADLIERDAVREAMGDCEAVTHSIGYSDMIAILDDAPAVNRWISVEDALPDNNRDVLVQYNPEYGSSYKHCTIAFFCKHTGKRIEPHYAVAFFGKHTGKWIEPISGQCLDVIKWRELIQE